nr:hypothetical protein [Candidatus Sigynarchaeum springense]MDO8117976.1 hypothetical protein [Candidatus Sigynarchaeota archaeon]
MTILEEILKQNREKFFPVKEIKTYNEPFDFSKVDFPAVKVFPEPGLVDHPIPELDWLGHKDVITSNPDGTFTKNKFPYMPAIPRE